MAVYRKQVNSKSRYCSMEVDVCGVEWGCCRGVAVPGGGATCIRVDRQQESVRASTHLKTQTVPSPSTSLRYK
jgi:hypothetical protein